jgi:hypothetical protein
MFLLCSYGGRRWIETRPRPGTKADASRPRPANREPHETSSVARLNTRDRKGWRPSASHRIRNRFGLFEADRSPPAFLAALTCLRAFAPGGRLRFPPVRASWARGPLSQPNGRGEHIHAVMKGASPSPAREETGDVELRTKKERPNLIV